jgi:diguanylate cyclase (GGDEF)-like protein
MLDLDHFKDFNDRYGHPAGDEALRAFAHLLTSSTREEDLAARYGGEEFAIYLPGRGEAEAAEVAERIRERTETTIIPLGPGKTGRITVSVGIAVAPDDGVDRSVLLKAADAALYQAKLAGRNRVVSRSASGAPSASDSPDSPDSSVSSADADVPRSASPRRRAAAG